MPHFTILDADGNDRIGSKGERLLHKKIAQID